MRIVRTDKVSPGTARILEAKRWVTDAVARGEKEAFGRAVDKAQSLGVLVLSRDDMTPDVRRDWDDSPLGKFSLKHLSRSGLGMMNWPFIRQEMEREMK